MCIIGEEQSVRIVIFIESLKEWL